MIISILPKEGKLIFSEKDNNPEEKKEILSKYTVGDDLDCEIAGIVDFGIFLKLEDGLEGLVHISELDWGLVEDPRTMFKVGEKIKAKVIEIKEGKISLSVKALKENPWKEFEGKLKKGDIIKGVVIKYNKHGALVSIKEGVAGLVHNSTFGSETALRTKLELGKTYNFQITLFEPKDHKMTLVYLEQ
jgi:ribosomal protein S1